LLSTVAATILVYKGFWDRTGTERQQREHVMKAKISARTVGNMHPGDSISDAEISGFSARCWDSGAITYSLRYRTGRDRKRILIGTHGNVTPDEARKIAKQRAGEIAGGRDPVAERRRAETVAANTVGSVWDAYAARELKTKRSAKLQMNSFDRLVRPSIGDRPIYDLKRGDMVRMLDGIEDDHGAVMADRMLAYLGRCFKWQQIRDEDFISPIISGLSRTSAKELARGRVLNDDEIRALWKVTADDTFGSLVRFLLLTAARRCEAAEMPWSELDGATWTLPAARNKVKVELIRPLSKAAMALLPPKRGDYVFNAISGFSSRKKYLDKQSGVTGWVLHDLRRTARSLMSRAGVPSDHAERCLGHVIGGVRGTYDRHAYYDEKAQAYEALAAQVDRIINPRDNVASLAERRK
jgi:integrase